MARLGKYELERTLGEGNFGKVKYARDVEPGEAFAIKILDRKRILHLKLDDQVKKEIGTLKLLMHPNVVRLHEVLASKTKIYMALEYENGGELFERVESKGWLQECEGRKLFQQLIDAIGYCHENDVYHRDLKPENILIDTTGNIKISDFGLSASPRHLGVIANRGYDGAMSDIWSCCVILYVILTGSLPFEDKNVVVLYQKILNGANKIPKWLPPGAQDLIRRILDPNPKNRINISGIREHKWFKQDYIPIVPSGDGEDLNTENVLLAIKEPNDLDTDPNMPELINAFQLIGMSSSLDLSGFFEKELKVMQQGKSLAGPRSLGSFSVAVEVFKLNPFLYVVELRKSHGDSSL